MRAELAAVAHSLFTMSNSAAYSGHEGYHNPDLQSNTNCSQNATRSGARRLWRLGIVGGVGVVAKHLRDDGTADQRLQLGLERIRFIFRVDLIAADIEREGFGVF